MIAQKNVFRIILFTSGIAILFSCNRGSFTCKCSTGVTGGQTYNIGNTTYSDASGKCIALKQQYAWDTCLTVEAK